MKTTNKMRILLGTGLLAAFTLWTVLVCLCDIQAIGPYSSSVGFASLNGYIHGGTGVNWLLYTITDWLGLVPIGTAFCFAILGLVQWVMRKSLLKVDKSILALGVFYLIVIVVYVFFTFVVINYRPILIDGNLEASYPSSTTMLVMCVMPTAMIQLHARIKNNSFRQCILVSIALFTAFMVIGRVMSGVHWISDIIGGVLISGGLVSIYAAVSNMLK